MVLLKEFTGNHPPIQTTNKREAESLPRKLANLERVVNRGMLVVLGAQFALALLSSILLLGANRFTARRRTNAPWSQSTFFWG